MSLFKKDEMKKIKDALESGTKVAVWDLNYSVEGVVLGKIEDISKIYSLYDCDWNEVVFELLEKDQKYYWETNQGEGPGYGDSCCLRKIDYLETITG